MNNPILFRIGVYFYLDKNTCSVFTCLCRVGNICVATNRGDVFFVCRFGGTLFISGGWKMKNKTLLKTLSTILAVLMLLCSAPLSGFVGIELPDLFSLKAEAYTEGNFTYSVYSGKATLTGCVDATGDIVIPETLGGYPVTGIDDYAFRYCTSLTSITIPDSVASIDYSAFYNCTSLENVYYTGDIESWCGIEFYDADSNPMYYAKNFYINNTLVKEIVIPDTVTEIKDSAFYSFEGITSVTIGNGVTIIGYYAFKDCTSLENVYYTGDIESWCGIEFYDADSNPMYYAKKFYINNTLVKEIVIPDIVTEIKDCAFYSFEGITSVTIGNGVTSIGDCAFYNCTSLASVAIGSGVTSIGDCAFYNCTSLARVYYMGDIESWCRIEFALICANPMIYAKNFYINNTLVTEIVIPETITEIKYEAFCSFEGITSIIIPDSVTSIGHEAFSGCTSLTSVTIPDSVTSIGDGAFYNCTSLASVTIGNNVTNIGYAAFRGCTGLTSVTIPNSVTRIEDDVFYNCTSLENVYYTGDIASWCNISFDNYESNPMYYAENFYINNILIKEVVIPDTVTEIKDYTFYGFNGITSVTIPDSVMSIGDYAFCECDSLESIVIHEGVTSIRESAFRWCYGLTSVTIPESVITIREGAFAGCYNIENVYYAGTDEQWDEIAIYDGNDCLKNANKTFLNGGHAHVYNSSVTTEPTCTETGVKTYKCYCGNTYTESIPATGHTWGKWIVTVEPTATKDGRKVRACTVCVEAVQEETIPKGTSPEEPSEPETKFSVKVNDFTLNYKGTAKLNPEIKSLLKYNVEYSSSDESVVTVDKDGNVTATGEGTAEITVRVTNTFGMTVEDTCKVTVTKAWWQWLIIIFLFGWIWYI